MVQAGGGGVMLIAVILIFLPIFILAELAKKK